VRSGLVGSNDTLVGCNDNVARIQRYVGGMQRQRCLRETASRDYGGELRACSYKELSEPTARANALDLSTLRVNRQGSRAKKPKRRFQNSNRGRGYGRCMIVGPCLRGNLQIFLRKNLHKKFPNVGLSTI